MNEAKPCPFCGSEADVDGLNYVWCKNEDCAMNIGMLLTTWNTRRPDRTEELEKVIRRTIGIGLVTDCGEEFAIAMRDTGFEFKYAGKWYEAKEGHLKIMGNLAEQEKPDG